MIKKPFRIIFFGTPSFGIPTLQQLLEGEDELVAIVTQPDRPKGRGQKIRPSEVKEFVQKRMGENFTILQPESLNDENFQETLKALKPDIFIVVAYGQILPKTVLEIPKYGAINLHASLLPKYRGASPIAWAILNGDKVTGITTIQMDEGLDTGPILIQKEIEIKDDDTTETLQDRLAQIGSQIMIETIKRIKEGSLKPKSQDHSQASYAPLIKKEDGRIDWKKSAEEINRMVRAFNPWPGAFTHLNGKLLKIYRGCIRMKPSLEEPGKIIWVGSDFIEVQTGGGSFLIKELQFEGKKRMLTRDFLSGHHIPVGLILD